MRQKKSHEQQKQLDHEEYYEQCIDLLTIRSWTVCSTLTPRTLFLKAL